MLFFDPFPKTEILKWLFFWELNGCVRFWQIDDLSKRHSNETSFCASSELRSKFLYIFFFKKKSRKKKKKKMNFSYRGNINPLVVLIQFNKNHQTSFFFSEFTNRKGPNLNYQNDFPLARNLFKTLIKPLTRKQVGNSRRCCFRGWRLEAFNRQLGKDEDANFLFLKSQRCRKSLCGNMKMWHSTKLWWMSYRMDVIELENEEPSRMEIQIEQFLIKKKLHK